MRSRLEVGEGCEGGVEGIGWAQSGVGKIGR